MLRVRRWARCRNVATQETGTGLPLGSWPGIREGEEDITQANKDNDFKYCSEEKKMLVTKKYNNLNKLFMTTI